MKSTAATIKLLAALAGLSFRAMDEHDFYLFADAQPDAMIAEATDALAEAMSEITGQEIELHSDDPYSVVVIASGERVECYGLSPTQGDTWVTLTLGE